MWQVVGVIVSPLKYAVFWIQAKFHRTIRPRVVILYRNEVLVIRNWGDVQWSLPGGGLHRGETPETGAVRESSEELGITIPAAELENITTLRRDWYDAPIYLWRTAVKPSLKLQKLEITGHRWVTKESLPPLEENLRDIIMNLDF